MEQLKRFAKSLQWQPIDARKLSNKPSGSLEPVKKYFVANFWHLFRLLGGIKFQFKWKR